MDAFRAVTTEFEVALQHRGSCLDFDIMHGGNPCRVAAGDLSSLCTCADPHDSSLLAPCRFRRPFPLGASGRAIGAGPMTPFSLDHRTRTGGLGLVSV